MMYLIDSPTPLDTLEVWKKFRAKMVALPQPWPPEVWEAVRKADKMIQEKRGGDV